MRNQLHQGVFIGCSPSLRNKPLSLFASFTMRRKFTQPRQFVSPVQWNATSKFCFVEYRGHKDTVSSHARVDTQNIAQTVQLVFFHIAGIIRLRAPASPFPRQSADSGRHNAASASYGVDVLAVVERKRWQFVERIFPGGITARLAWAIGRIENLRSPDEPAFDPARNVPVISCCLEKVLRYCPG